MRSAHPVLAVRSVPEALRWYTETLGFDAVYVNGAGASCNYAVLENGGAGLHLGLEADMRIAAGQGACSIAVTDLDAIHARLTAAHAPVYLPLGTVPTGARTFGVEDPDGNRLAFVEVRAP